MQLHTRAVALAAVIGAVTAPAALGQAPAPPAADMMNAVAAKSITWTDLEVPGFPSGMKLAVLQGNPDATGEYTLRLSFPDGYRFPAHWHPMVENLTVLSGALLLAMGDKVDESQLKTYVPGDYLYLPATKPHFGGAKGYTEIQLHGQGPFAINLVN